MKLDLFIIGPMGSEPHVFKTIDLDFIPNQHFLFHDDGDLYTVLQVVFDEKAVKVVIAPTTGTSLFYRKLF